MKERISILNQYVFKKITLLRLKIMVKLGLLQAPVARLFGTCHVNINNNTYAIHEYVMEYKGPDSAVSEFLFRYTTGDCNSPIIDTPSRLNHKDVSQAFSTHI